MYWKEIRKTEHFKEYHSNTLSWIQILRLIHQTKCKRKKGNKILLETENIYILCELKGKILYVINVKIK